MHQVWSSAGCALRNASIGSVAICDCTHLTMFSVQVCVCSLASRCCYLNSQITEFAPQVRTLSSQDFLNLNWDNIKKHPFSLIACSVFWFLYFVALFLAVRRDRQLLNKLKQLEQPPCDDSTTANATAIEMTSLSATVKMDAAHLQLLTSEADRRDSSVRRCWRWFKQSRVGDSFRDQHLWLSVALRPSNARLSSQDRLLCVLVLILTSMCCSAIFFGNGSGESDIIVTLISLAISFFSVLPVLFLLRGGSFQNAPLSEIELKRMAAGLPKLHGRWPLWGPRFAYAFGSEFAQEVAIVTWMLCRYLLALTLTMLIFVYVSLDLSSSSSSARSSI